MNRLASLAIAAAFAAAPAFAQRIEFPRQSFDRSRFGQPSPAATPAPASVRPAPSAPAAVSPAAAPAASPAAAQSPSGRVPDELVASPRWDLIPHKAFDNPKDYDQLLELQRQTGACLLIYFRNNNDSSEKGLCNWYEKSIGLTRDWQKVTRPYLKLTVVLPGNSAAQALATRYHVMKTPAIYVQKPNDFRAMRLSVFEWPNGEPKPLPVDTVVEQLLKLGTDAYREHVQTLR